MPHFDIAKGAFGARYLCHPWCQPQQFLLSTERGPSEAVLRAEIQKLAGAYPRYGYRRITQLLVRQGYTVGTRRVARLMKAQNLLVSIKRAIQTTKSLQETGPWSNLLEDLEISHQDQVWVADITYVRLKERFIYLALLMDVFTRMIRGWHLSRQLHTSLTLKPLKTPYAKASRRSIIPIRRAVSFKGVSLAAQGTRYSDFDRSQRASLGERIRRTVDPNPQGGRSSSQRLSRHPMRRENASVILSHRCITKNARIRR